MSKESTEFRIACKMHDAIRDRGLETPEDVIRYDDIVYDTKAKEQVLDVYRPKKEEGKILPVIVSVHGGGWVYGDKELYQFYCMSLAQQGFAVVNFTYRLAPEYKFPASTEDTNSVFAWVLANDKTYGFDRDRIYALGDSAGANMLGVYANILTNPSYAEKFPFETPKGLKLRAIALNCGKYDMEQRPEEEPKLRAFLFEDYLPENATEEDVHMLNVAQHMTDDFPPAYVMTCTGDYLKKQASILVKALEDHEIPFLYRYYANKKNPLFHVFHLNMRSEEAARCNRDECEFFNKY